MGTRTEIDCSTGSQEDVGTKPRLVLVSPSTLEMGLYSVSMATGCAPDDRMGRLGWSCGRIAIRLIALRRVRPSKAYACFEGRSCSNDLGSADWDSMASYARTLMMSVSKDDSAAAVPVAGIPQDELHKSLFTNVEAVRDAIVDFARHSLPNAEEWVDRLDFDTLQPMPTETVDKAFRSRFNDRV